MWKQFVKTAIAAILNKQFVYVFVTDGVDVFTLLVKLLRPPMVSPASSCFLLFSLFFYYNYNHLTASFPGQPG